MTGETIGKRKGWNISTSTNKWNWITFFFTEDHKEARKIITFFIDVLGLIEEKE